MNIELLTKIAEWLEAGGKHEKKSFNMETGIRFHITDLNLKDDINDCRTSCCLAGAAVQFGGETAKVYDNDGSVDNYKPEVNFGLVADEAQELLQLSEEQAEDLFTPNNRLGKSLSYYNDAAWAARTIRHLIATGEVDWMAVK